jgi:hypothetical protein
MISGFLAISAMGLLYLDMAGRALIAGGILIVWFLIFQAIDFQYINFTIGEEKLTLRFYPAVKFGRKDYQTIEFPSKLLHEYVIEKSVFGLVNDITLLVKTKRGVAEYPSVSMAALNKADRKNIDFSLRELLNRK